jgi:glucose/arabinose dehydrogenase
VKTPGAVPTIWSYGHRNPEGFAWDPVSGTFWESEHGPNSADEINVIEKGHNYGWAVASKAAQPGLELSIAGMDDPVVYFTPTYAPAGIAFYTGTRYPGWRNASLFVSGLRGQALRRLEIKGKTVVSQEVLFNQFGRVRDIAQSPDGYFYIALQDPTGVPNPAGGGTSRYRHRPPAASCG